MALLVRYPAESPARVDPAPGEIDPISTREPSPRSLNQSPKALAAAAGLLRFATLTGCRADSIVFSIDNMSGGTLHDVKVSYPGGKLTLATVEDSGVFGTFRHFDGSGELTVCYATEVGGAYNSSGRRVTGNEKGEVKVRIDPSHARIDTKFEQSQQ